MERHAVQRPERAPLGNGRVGGFGIAQCLIGADGDEAVERGLGFLGARQRGAHHLRCGDPLGADQGGKLGGGHEGEVGGRHGGSRLVAGEDAQATGRRVQ